MDYLFKTFDELERSAIKCSKNAPKRLQHSTYLYFIARFFVSMYEVLYAEIPIQVWNEYRNALDHLFRYISTPVENDHLKKMEGHLLRSVLDITKLMYYKSKEYLDNEGNIYKDDEVVRQLASAAEELFIKARQEDIDLGGESNQDVKILKLYMQCAFLVIDLRSHINNKITSNVKI
ncbi:hypothetical protein [Methylomicrobium lacus]|uniref:hypothetical protein n=1 Tax=Methylomicrobium lacus TaxID=136992 RepID=UPI0035A81BC1